MRYERAIVAGAILLLVALAWWFLAAGAGMEPMDGMAMEPPPYPALVIMWWLMMVAMMVPSAAPTILLYTRVRQQRRSSGSVVHPAVFAAGYLLVWLGFSIAAAGLQLLAAGQDMAVTSPTLASALLIAAGAYQLSPWKGACLAYCRSPAQFLSRNWRRGTVGAVRLGILHGAYCLGCCWALMTLLFVGGVMNFAWIAALTLIVGIEKLVPRGDLFAKALGVALIAWGVARLLV